MDVKSFFFLNCFCLLFLYFNPFVDGNSPFGKCANPECSEPISKGITILRYASPDDNRISVEPNEEVFIYVKEYGPKKDLWGITVKGNRGYISKGFIRETNLLSKGLFPAVSEFKTSLLAVNSYSVSSNLHVASHQHQSDNMFSNTVPQSVQHTHSVQNDFVHSAPSSDQHTWNSHSEDLQASHLSPNLNPSHSIHHNPQSRFDQSSQVYNVPDSSSQFHLDSGNVLPSHHMTGVQTENIIPSPTRVPDVKYSPSFQSPPDDSLLNFQVFKSSVNNVPDVDFSHSGQFHPSPAFKSKSVPSFNQHPSSIQQQQLQDQYLQNQPLQDQYIQNQHLHSQQFQNQHLQSQQFQNQHLQSQQFQSPPVLEMHSSSNLDDFDDEISKTYAMLSNMGFDNTDMYVNQESNVRQSSQNLERNSNGDSYFPSQSQYPPVQGSDASFYSSVNPSPQVNDVNQATNSDTLKVFSENVKPFENIAVANEEMIQKLTSQENQVGNDESEVLAEVEDDSDYYTNDDEDYGEDEDEENMDTQSINDLISSSKNMESAMSGFHLQSSMSSNQVNQQASSSVENSIVDSILVDSSLNERTTSKQQETTDILSNEAVSSNINLIPQETSIPEKTLISNSTIQSTVTENFIDRSIEPKDSLNLTKSNLDETIDAISNSINPVVDENSKIINEKKIEIMAETFPKKDVFSNVLDRNNNDALATESSIYNKEHTTPKINEFFVEKEQISEVNEILNTIDTDPMEDLTTYQNRNLKGEFGTTEETQSDSEGGSDENNTQSESDSCSSFGNWLDALKSAVDFLMSWIPEPLYSVLMDLGNKGISPRVPVFTVVCGFTIIFLIVPVYYIKKWSKEGSLSAQLADVEKKAYALSATNVVLEEKIESLQSELAAAQASLADEKNSLDKVRSEFYEKAEECEDIKRELTETQDGLNFLKERNSELEAEKSKLEREKECYAEHKESLDKILKDQENSITTLTDQLLESENKVTELEKEKERFLLMKLDYEEKLAQFDQNCNQLLQEAEVWNLKVTELTEEVMNEKAAKEELVVDLKSKEEEIVSLKELLETFKIFDEIEDPEEHAKAKEEKLESLLNTTMIANQLKNEEEKSKLLDEQLGKEKNRILEMEVELLEAKSEIDKLKMSYNQALQDKAEAQTKLEVLTNYFKDKEIQLQRQLGAQEAVRQKTEEDASSAERRIILIEQENTSYKSQVASMKQEMEETERNLKSQIAAQEKKAHENWIAARAAERKLEDMKQEVTQLRQRLTLLEREQENWVSASRDEIVRPVPKRMPGVNDESGSQDLNSSERGMFAPPPLHDRLPPVPPMMLPPDRPLPPLPPPPIPPMFLPPMERHFRPWHMPPDHASDYRTTPPEFMGGRELTPPRGRQSTITEGDNAPHTSSPLTTDTRDSRNSTPPHLLPDFHDVPPQPGRPFYPPPPLGRPRFPMHPPFRRDAGPEPKRFDNPNEFNSRGPQQPPPPEQWQHSRV